MEPQYNPKELSWLSFNERVLQEAENPTTPLIERVRFLGIFSSNQDEFYRVRVADIRRLANFSSGSRKEHYDTLLGKINRRVMQLQKRFDSCHDTVMSALADNNIYLIEERQLQESQREFVTRYFFNHILNFLEPFFIDEVSQMPVLNEASIYFAIQLTQKDRSHRYAALEIPSERMDRFVEIPARQGRKEKVFIVIDNIIRTCLEPIFRGVLDTRGARAFTFKISRDAELELGEGITQSHINRVANSLKKRTEADPVRFVYDRAMPEELLGLITRKLRMGRYDSYTPGGRYHNAKDFMKFPHVGAKKFVYPPLKRLRFDLGQKSLFDNIADKDILLYYPYHDFQAVIDLISTAAIDPQVKSISISLYRVAADSRIAAALVNATRNGKRVVVVLELQARFDEQANISWAQRLTDAGVYVIFGVPGLKVHSKIISIVRQEGGSQRYYSHIGTGNFNESTAALYCDVSLFTAHQEIGKEIASVFNFIGRNYQRPALKHLRLSPYTTREGIVAGIQREIDNANKGLKARIQFKCNNLVDEEVITKLYEASAAGVEVQLIIRSMCSLIPEQAGLSENIRAISVVDKYLEHARLYIFHNGGQTEYFISSADLMTRNLDYRVEVSCPIYDSDHQHTLQRLFDTQWQDNVKARSLASGQENQVVNSQRKRKLRSQDAIARWLAR